MDVSYYKNCMVPQCESTSIKTPNKLFIFVPSKAEVRKKWLSLAGRNDAKCLSSISRMYFCEDHFDIENDMANYYQYKMGFSQKMILKDKVLPSKFHCQPDRIKRMCDAGTSRSAFVKRQRKKLVKQCEDIQQPMLTSDEPTATVVEACTKEEPEELEKPVERTCRSCKQTWFWGFVYRCLQCEFVHCAACDAAGVHSDHYVLRVPSARPKEEEEAVMCKIWDAVNSCPFPPSATDHALRQVEGVEPPDGSPGDQANPDGEDASATEQEVVVKLEFEATENDPLATTSSAPESVPRQPTLVVKPGMRIMQDHAPTDEATGMGLSPEFFTSQVNLGVMIFKEEPPDYDEPSASTSDLPSTSHASLGDHTYFEPLVVTHKKKETVPAKRKNDKNNQHRQPMAKRGRPRKKKKDTDQD